MKKVFAIVKKELNAYFNSPIAYIILIVTLIVFNVFFYMIIDGNREASLRDVFRLMEFMFVFLVPILTMKIFSEENSSGTMEFLMTSPITNIEIIMGKYLGSLIFFSSIILLTSVYYFIIEFFGSPDMFESLSGYISILLEGSMFIAIGLMTSSWTRSQIVAALCSYLIIFSLYFSGSFTKYLDGTWKSIISYFGVMNHSENFIVGVISTSDLIYFLSTIIVCIIITRISINRHFAS